MTWLAATLAGIAFVGTAMFILFAVFALQTWWERRHPPKPPMDGGEQW